MALLSRAIKHVETPPNPPCAESFLALDGCVLLYCKNIVFLESLIPLCISGICIYLGVWIYSPDPKHYALGKSTNIALLCINSYFYLSRKSDGFHQKVRI